MKSLSRLPSLTHVVVFFGCTATAAFGQTAALPPPVSPPVPDAAQYRPAAPAPPQKRQTFTRQVARGVELVQEIVPASEPGGPLVVTVLRVNPKAKGVRVEAALGQDRIWGTDPAQGREIVSKLAARRGAVAGINAGFFPFAGNPIGLHVENGDLVTEPAANRTVFAMTKDGAPRFEVFTFTGRVSKGDASATYPLHGLNRQPGKGNEILLFTPRFFGKTLKAPGRFEVVLSGITSPLTAWREYAGKVVQSGEGGETPLAPGTVVLSGGGAGAEFLRQHAASPGAVLRFRLEVNGGSLTPDKIREAVAGGPRLITGGRVTIRTREEGMSAAFERTRHPRTAVGVTRSGTLLLMTVDGRQTTLSRGVSLPELANLLLKYGAVDAVNMDGGGSSVLVVRDLVVSSPSGGIERAVANALLVYADPLPPSGGKSAASLSQTGNAPAPLSAPVTVGSIVPLAKEDNAAGVGNKEASGIIWGTRGGVGFVSQGGVFYALRPGRGEVYVTGAGASGSGGGDNQRRIPVSIVGKSDGDRPGFAARLTLLPSADTPSGASSGEQQQQQRSILLIRIANSEGDALAGETVAITVTGGRPDAATAHTDARGETRVGIVWDAETPPRMPREVTVTSPAKRFPAARITGAAAGAPAAR